MKGRLARLRANIHALRPAGADDAEAAAIADEMMANPGGDLAQRIAREIEAELGYRWDAARREMIPPSPPEAA